MSANHPKIGLGTVQFGIPYGINNQSGQTTSEEVTTILNTAKKAGIQYIDTASAYGNSEEVLGKNDLSSFKVISKFMPMDEFSLEINTQLNNSLEKLQIKSLYGYMAHRPLSILSDTKTWGILENLKSKGLVQKIGGSFNHPDEVTKLLNAGIVPDIIQVPFNYFDNRFKESMLELKELGCEIHTRSAFLQGLFFKDASTLHSHFKEVEPFLISLQQEKNLSGALLKYCLKMPFIDCVIIGVENNYQLVQNLETLMDAENLASIDVNLPDSILMPALWPKN